MKLFLDRNKTLLPRLDSIYLLTRLGVLIIYTWYIFDHGFNNSDTFLAYAIIISFAVHLAIFFYATRSVLDIKLAYLSSIIIDILIVPTMITLSGGFNSSFYLMFLMTISVAAYVLRFWFAATITAIAISIYLVSIHSTLNVAVLFDASLRTGLFLLLFLTISYISDYMRRSEKRLLRLFDTLNLRTSELERSRRQMEMVYINMRNLSTILKPENVIKEITEILSSVLDHPNHSIIFRDKANRFIYRVRSVGGRANFQMKFVDIEQFKLIKMVNESDEPVRVLDIRKHDDYGALDEGALSAMVVPMNSHGHINGVITVESNTLEAFNERDLQALSTVARSAALALENAELHKQTEELTIIDGLTGAFNYRYFIRKFEEEKKRASRYGLSLSLIMIDIDWFKKFNDTYGHETGNLVLKHLAEVIKGSIRDVDIFARYGGEEFVVILPQTNRNEALVIGERIRKHVQELSIETGGKQLKITVSVGVSSFPENGQPHDELVSVADRALYQAKDEGRNHVCII
ncbi:MAG: sensor domain-containing diguanylate cyclase [candidate division Zixibacteria bacterium]|nr:sensor domain-containing diguanylate cyclase [candidate division Zixibacteria bacterium]